MLLNYDSLYICAERSASGAGAARMSLSVGSCCLGGVSNATFWLDSGRRNMTQQPIFVAACSVSVWCVGGTIQPENIKRSLFTIRYPVVWGELQGQTSKHSVDYHSERNDSQPGSELTEDRGAIIAATAAFRKVKHKGHVHTVSMTSSMPFFFHHEFSAKRSPKTATANSSCPLSASFVSSQVMFDGERFCEKSSVKSRDCGSL